VGETKLRYGVLLPHFGSHASRERIIESATRIERYGFDSVWVRDHVVFHPHPHEDQNRTHVDPFITLGAVAAVTERLLLGTGTLIPHRHPIHAALSLGCLDFLAGPGRVIAGWGIGGYQHEFDAMGMVGWDRKELWAEQIAIIRKLWTAGDAMDHEGKYYRFHDVNIQPVPAQPIPLWYGGNTPAAVRRTVESCDGWLPARIPRSHFRRMLDRMRRLAEEARKPLPTIGSIPFVVPARTVEEASRYCNIPALVEEMSHSFATPPPAGATLEALDHAVIGGPVDVILEGLRACQHDGAEHVVFDMRPRFRDFDECLQLIGEEVLPVLLREDGRAPRLAAG